jgi:hypothetical protein
VNLEINADAKQEEHPVIVANTSRRERSRRLRRRSVSCHARLILADFRVPLVCRWPASVIPPRRNA